MGYRTQLACVWSELIVVVMLGSGVFLVAGFLPPHHPTWSAEQIAAIFQENTFGIRAGMVMSMAGSFAIYTFAAVISEQMKRIPNIPSILERCQLGAGGLGQMIFANIVFVLWMAAAYRPERDPQLILLLNDICWITIIGMFIFGVLQSVTIAWAVFCDQGTKPVFPRWVAYLNIWVAVSYLLAMFIVFFKTGPFAWNGLLAFVVPYCVFAVWIGLMIYALLGAIHEQAGKIPATTGGSDEFRARQLAGS